MDVEVAAVVTVPEFQLWLHEPPLHAVTLVAVANEGVLEDTVDGHEAKTKLTALGRE